MSDLDAIVREACGSPSHTPGQWGVCNCAAIRRAIEKALEQAREQDRTENAGLHELLMQAWANLDPEDKPELTSSIEQIAVNCGNDLCKRLHEAEAEIKRLTADQQDWARRWKLNDVTPWDWMTRAEKAEADAERLAVALRKQGEFLDRVMPDSRVDAWFELAAPALAAHEEASREHL